MPVSVFQNALRFTLNVLGCMCRRSSSYEHSIMIIVIRSSQPHFHGSVQNQIEQLWDKTLLLQKRLLDCCWFNSSCLSRVVKYLQMQIGFNAALQCICMRAYVCMCVCIWWFAFVSSELEGILPKKNVSTKEQRNHVHIFGAQYKRMFCVGFGVNPMHLSVNSFYAILLNCLVFLHSIYFESGKIVVSLATLWCLCMWASIYFSFHGISSVRRLNKATWKISCALYVSSQ